MFGLLFYAMCKHGKIDVEKLKHFSSYKIFLHLGSGTQSPTQTLTHFINGISCTKWNNESLHILTQIVCMCVFSLAISALISRCGTSVLFIVLCLFCFISLSFFFHFNFHQVAHRSFFCLLALLIKQKKKKCQRESGVMLGMIHKVRCSTYNDNAYYVFDV